MRALGQEKASKHHRAARTKPAGKACASTRESHPASCRHRTQAAHGRGRRDGRRTRCREQALGMQLPRCWLHPECFPPPRIGCVMGQEAQGPGTLDARLQERPSGALPASALFLPSSLCPQPKPHFIFFASSCPGFGGPIAPCGTKPGLGQHGRSQTGPTSHLCRRMAQASSCSPSSAARPPAPAQQRRLCGPQRTERGAESSAGVPCSGQAPGRAADQASRSLCTGESEARGPMAFYTTRSKRHPVLSCPATPNSRGCQPAGQTSRNGQGRRAEECRQQAVTARQKATQVQPSPGLGLIPHQHSAHRCSCCKAPTSNTHGGSAPEMCNAGPVLPWQCKALCRQAVQLQVAASAPRASHPAQTAKPKAARHPRGAVLQSHTTPLLPAPHNCLFTPFSLALPHSLASSFQLLLVYPRHAFLLASLSVSSIPQR